MSDGPPGLDDASHEELKELVQTQRQEIAELRRHVAALHDENARLKGKPPRPDVKSSSASDKEGSGDVSTSEVPNAAR